LRLALGALLITVTLAAFSPAVNFQFLAYDDSVYVANNPRVQEGLTWRNVRWALTTVNVSNWHPLTWLSHMLDCTLFGLDAGLHHLTSVLLHTANGVLLFFVLTAMTHALWRSALAAALFAVHPLHVESVAWVAERKDVLSTFFWVLALGAYVRWTRAPHLTRYALVVLAFALGLMAKPMLVTFPFVLLLLDAWPLGRVASGVRPMRLVWEKVPLFALAAAASAITVVAQGAGGAVRSIADVSIYDRMANALLSYAGYLGKTLWPVDLACFYPYRRGTPAVAVGAAALLLAAISVATIRAARRRPYLLVGWLWFLGTLVPVIGIVQVGPQGMADRYTYVPLIGIFIIVSWGLADLLASVSAPQSFRGRDATAGPRCADDPTLRPVWSAAAAVVAVLAIGACFALTRRQVAYWRDGVTLFEHAHHVVGDDNVVLFDLAGEFLRQGHPDEAMAHYREALRLTRHATATSPSLADVLIEQGWPAAAAARQAAGLTFHLGNALWGEQRIDDAMAQYSETIRLDPDMAEARNNLGLALEARGRQAEATMQYRVALRIQPDYVDARYNLANALARQGNLKDAITEYRATLALRPDLSEARNNLGMAIERTGDIDGAIAVYEEALRVSPEFVNPYINLGSALRARGRLDDATDRYRQALRLAPTNAEAHYGLANVLTQQGRRKEAIAEYEAALKTWPGFALAHNNLGLVLAAEGRLAEAIAHYSEALRIDPSLAIAYYNRSAARRSAGDTSAADADLAEARARDPRVPR
jgi:tetratricopeptide (TPR) repeat protein